MKKESVKINENVGYIKFKVNKSTSKLNRNNGVVNLEGLGAE